MKKVVSRAVVLDAVQMVETSRTQRKFGVSVEYNTGELLDLTNAPVHTHFRPNGTPSGRVEFEVAVPFGTLKVGLNGWFVKLEDGTLRAYEDEEFNRLYRQALVGDSL